MRTCLFCRHFDSWFEGGSGCDTCGDDGSFRVECKKGNNISSTKGWTQSETRIDSKGDLFTAIRRGADCPDFDTLTDEEIAAL